MDEMEFVTAEEEGEFDEEQGDAQMGRSHFLTRGILIDSLSPATKKKAEQTAVDRFGRLRPQPIHHRPRCDTVEARDALLP